MRIGRTIPPAAAPVSMGDLVHALTAAIDGDAPLRARENEIRREFGVGHVFLVSSGSAAITLLLTALKTLVPARDVVIPAYTCFSVPAAVLKAGLRPVPCDINPATFDFNHALLERALTPDTLCVVTHHLFGLPSDVDRTRAICRARGIFVLEDAAQAMGLESGGRKLGTLGDAGIFSFGRGKHVTCGSGGAIVTSSAVIATAVAREYERLPPPPLVTRAADFLKLALMTVFIRPRLYWLPAAVPFLRLGDTIFPADVPVRRMAGTTAAVLRGWRERLARANRIRLEATSYFRRALALSAEPRPLLRLPLLVSTADEKRSLCSLSKSRGLGLSAGYPSPISDIPQVRSVMRPQQFPAARRVADHLVTIPTHQWVSERDRRAIADLFVPFSHAC